MPAETGYDTTRFEALRRQLGALNEGAIADGLVAVRDGVVVSPEKPRRAPRKAAALGAKVEPEAKTAEKTPDRSPAAARRLLALLSRSNEDESPDVAGTSFTEAGVVRLLAHLRARRKKRGGGAWVRFLLRADRYLARPVPLGIRTVQGVGFERLQVLARQLGEIESSGWARFRAARAVQRRKIVAAAPLRQDEAIVEPAELRREGTS